MTVSVPGFAVSPVSSSMMMDDFGNGLDGMDRVWIWTWCRR